MDRDRRIRVTEGNDAVEEEDVLLARPLRKLPQEGDDV